MADRSGAEGLDSNICQCRAVVIHPDGHAHRCHMPAVEPFEDEPGEPPIVPTLCDYHLEMDIVWGIQVPESYNQHPTGAELLAAVARGLSKTTTFDLVGGHHDWMFWAYEALPPDILATCLDDDGSAPEPKPLGGSCWDPGEECGGA